MYSPPRHDKKAALVAQISRRIEMGELRPGDRLPGEFELAQQYGVSRGTVRGALAELNSRSIIQTQGGVGSFVAFDGVGLNQPNGWTVALGEGAARVATELLRIAPIAMPASALCEGMARAFLIERRRLANGTAVSLERSCVPAIAELGDLASTGLVGGSITATLSAAGLVGFSYRQDVGAQMLSPADAALMERRAGTTMLHVAKVSRARDGTVVEYVESLLDPAHFCIRISGEYA